MKYNLNFYIIREGICNLKTILGEIKIVQKLNINEILMFLDFFLLVAIYTLHDCSNPYLNFSNLISLLKKYLLTLALLHSPF